MFGDSINSATPIRFPSTANLNINSSDRDENNYPNSSDFIITQQQNILSGFFTRLAITEMVLDWGVPNVNALAGNNILTVSVGGNAENVNLDTGFYTVSSIMSEIISQLNARFTGIAVFSFTGPTGSKSLRCVNTATPPLPTSYVVTSSKLATQLTLVTGVELSEDLLVSPYLLPDNHTYLDFASPQLTYQQGLKDASTAPISHDVLYRWNFGWDGPAPIDPDGYPIQQGYAAFVQRRYLSFPKMIRWTGTQPIGQLSFQVYDADGKIFQYRSNSYDFEWAMNILVSES